MMEGWGTIALNSALPLRDGVVLRADVYVPRTVPCACLLYRTPYGKTGALDEWTVFGALERRGTLAVVVVDVRGRHASQGNEFVPYFNEGKDGYDCVEWCAAQPWCNGNVGSFGISYPGACQWMAALEQPPHLRCMIPAFTYHEPASFVYFGGVFDGSWREWTLMNIAADLRARKNLPGPKTDDEAAEAFARDADRINSHLPLATLPDLQGVAPFYYDWLKHGPDDDAYWGPINLHGKIAARAAALPVLHISGWHDEAYGPSGAIANFDEQTCTSSRLIIGPWTHGAMESQTAGDVDYGPQALRFDYDALVIAFSERHLCGVRDAAAAVPDAPVSLFVMGSNRWLSLQQWPPASTPHVLSFASCLLGRPSAALLSDPLSPVRDAHCEHYGSHHYDTPPLPAGPEHVLCFAWPCDGDDDMTVAGVLSLTLCFRTAAKSFDFWARLLDNGWSLMHPGASVKRWHRPAHAPLDQVFELTLDMITCNTFKRGGAIQLLLSGSFMPWFSVNLHTGESEHVSSAAVSATVDVLPQSRLTLPLLKE